MMRLRLMPGQINIALATGQDVRVSPMTRPALREAFSI